MGFIMFLKIGSRACLNNKKLRMNTYKADNLKIISRLVELSKNELHYSQMPQPYNKEYIFLANHLNAAIVNLEYEFQDAFRYAVGKYKQSLGESTTGFGWFHEPEKLIYIRMQINQLKYAIYGAEFAHDLIFKEELGSGAYKDLIEQIDRTVLMTPEEKKSYEEEINKIGMEVIKELLAEEKKIKRL